MFTKTIQINDGQEAALTRLAQLEAAASGEPVKTAEEYLNAVLLDTMAGLRTRYIELRRSSIISALATADNATLAQVESLLNL